MLVKDCNALGVDFPAHGQHWLDPEVKEGQAGGPNPVEEAEVHHGCVVEQFAQQLLYAFLPTRPRHLGGKVRWTVAILHWVGSRLLSWAVLSILLCFAAAAAFVALLVLALALRWWCLCLLSLRLPGVVGWLLPIGAGLLHDVWLWQDGWDGGKNMCCRRNLPLSWPLPGVVLLAPPLVSLASSFVSTAFPVGLVALGALLVAVDVVRGPLFFVGGLHERIVHGGQVGHELLGDGVEGLGLPHPHGYIRFDLGKLVRVATNEGDPPITIFVDRFLGSKFYEDPGPAHRIDAILDHVEAPDVPV